MSQENKTIYDLKLHEMIEINTHLEITRVPGGWMYTYIDLSLENSRGVFVPYNDEFEKKTSLQKAMMADK